ncbi:MAG: hypothetical protein D6775_16340 [Caldilineae bacterium]|nr:MAG: hypothetical protein D6775_16340 [Caldilineae bacterium]
MGILDINPIGAIRRNHAIEHATIHILSRMRPQTNMAGRSDSRGFVIYGDVSTEAIGQAVAEAIERIRAGEAHLAIHPNCGTNLVTTAFLTSAATLLASAGRRRHILDRLASGLIGAMVGVVAGQFLGMNLQERITTCADLGAVRIVEIQRREFGKRVLHWIRLEHAPAAQES